MYVYCVYSVICIALIVFDGVLCDVYAYTVTVSNRCST